MKQLCLFMIRFYQWRLRHLHNRQCIYKPSCSNYMMMTIEKYGVIKGIYYGYLRIKRCNGALFAGGEDYP
jgi:uncharacterized protein